MRGTSGYSFRRSGKVRYGSILGRFWGGLEVFTVFLGLLLLARMHGRSPSSTMGVCFRGKYSVGYFNCLIALSRLAAVMDAFVS